jgi:hypothetical protein
MKRFVTALCIALTLQSAFADKYIRQGFASGSHTGNDWNNAYNGLAGATWSSNTFWMAGGIYTDQFVPSVAGVTLKRVRSTNSAPVAAAGWDPSFDSQVIIKTASNNTCQVNFNNLTIDGQIPYVGIIITNWTPTNYANAVYIVNPSAANSFRLVNCGVFGPNFDSANSPPISSADRRGLHCSTGLITNLYIGYCEFAYEDTLLSTHGVLGLTIEHNILHDDIRNNGDPQYPHNNIHMSSGITNCNWRYNIVRTNQVEGIMQDFVGSSDAINQNWNIYCNLWADHTSVGRVLVSQYVNNNNNMHVFNNTFVNQSFVIGLENGGSWGPGNWFSNNLVFAAGNSNNTGFLQGNDDYTLTDAATSAGSHSIKGASSSIFVDYAGHNYHIVTNVGALFPAGKGVDMSAYVTNDLDGVAFGSGGAWPIGAFEATASAPPDTTPPTVTGVTSSTSNGSYKAGDSISIQINFSEAVTVTGTPQLTLETGASDRTINYASGSGSSSLTFTYTVQSGDTTSDLDYTSTSSLSANGGTIRDSAGNGATLTLPSPGASGSLGANKSIAIDTTAPTVTITSPTSATTYSTSSSSVDISGSASDGSITWSNDRGGSGSCTGTTSWSKTGIILSSGVNVITITATDASNNTGTDTLSVTYTPPAAPPAAQSRARVHR